MFAIIEIGDNMKGLTKQEVELRIQQNKVNKQVNTNLKTTKQILQQNTFNYFNFLNVVLGMIILLSGQIKNVLFLLVIIINTSIAIFQELRSKKLIEKLTILAQNKVEVIRENSELIHLDEIVEDDILVLNTGQQIPVDGYLLEGNIEVDESSLTGESDTIHKKQKDTLYSGTFITSGTGLMYCEKVGENARIQQVVSQAKHFKIHPSFLRDTMNSILKFVTVFIVPIGICLFLKNYFIFHLPFEDVILKSVAPLIGMIPEGLILLTSVTLAIAVFTLGLKKILVQELYCVETLARVNVLCVDKTGTITTQQMRVEKVIGEINEIMPNYLNAFQHHNASEEAMINYFGTNNTLEVTYTLPFSSARKYSGVSFKEVGSYVVGAYEYLFKNRDEKHLEIIDEYAKQGLRILVVAHSEYGMVNEILPKDLHVVGWIVLSDILRENTKKIFDYFQSQNIAVKIISGDYSESVKAIALKAGFQDAHAIDVANLDENALYEQLMHCNVFGRVTPDQKKLIVKYFQNRGCVVAMTGDGVNDVLALKQADVSIAMAEGSDASKQISNIVLLESDFHHLYEIMMEGRRVINNIQTVATLFLTKTFSAIFLALITLFTNFSFPFIPIQYTLISALTIGIPGFILTLEKNEALIQPHFMQSVIKKSILAASCLVFGLIGLRFVHPENFTTCAVIFSILNGFVVIYFVGRPFNLYKMLLLSILFVAFVVIYSLFHSFFGIQLLSISSLCIVLLFGIMSFIVQFYCYKKYEL